MPFFCSDYNPESVGYLGTSITANGGYITEVGNYAGENVPFYSVSSLNTGVGGSTSWYALASQLSLIVAQNPRVVSIEFAVNDTTATLYAETAEALIRRIRTLLPSAKIVFIAFAKVSNPALNDATNLNQVLHDRWKSLCETYGVSFASFADLLYQTVNVNGGTLADYLSDTVHPTAAGHALAAVALAPAVMAGFIAGPMPALPERVYDSEDLENAPVVRNGVDNDGESGTWTTSGTDRVSNVAGSTITYTAVCCTFGINHTSAGSIRWRVDGGSWTTIDLSSYGAGTELTRTAKLPRASHTVNIEVLSGTVTIKRFLSI